MTHRLVTPPRLVASALCCALGVSVVSGAAVVESKRSYNLPSGDAASTLNQFAGASGQQIIFMMDKVKGERTNAIAGDYAARDALDRMLAGTGLSATRDPATGAFVVSRKRTALTQKESEDSDRARGPPAGLPNPPPSPPTNAQSQPKESPPVNKRTFLSLLFLAFSSSHAADSPTANGTIIGYVQNLATGSPLTNASVTVTRIATRVETGRDGRYAISLPPGSHSLTATYSGLDPATSTVEVIAGKTTELNFDLTSGIYKLDKFVVRTIREDDALSLQQQRHASGLKSVVATNAHGAPADNPGEIMQRLSGINVGYLDGQIATFAVRGMGPEFSKMTVDGESVATSFGNLTSPTRIFNIAEAATNNLSQVELIKAPTPDLDADSISGTVNLVTRRSYDRPASLQLSTALSGVRRGFDTTPNKSDLGKFGRASLSYNDTFGVLGGKKNLGASFDVGWMRILGVEENTGPRQVDTLQNSYVNGTTANPLNRFFATNESGGPVEKINASASIDYKFSSSSFAFLKASYTRHDRNDPRYGIRAMGAANSEAAFAPGSTFQNSTVLPTANTLMSLTGLNSVRQARSFNISTGGEYRFPDQATVLSVLGAYSFAVSKNPYFLNTTADLRGVGYQIDRRETSLFRPKLIQTAGPSWTDPANYRLTTLTNIWTRGAPQDIYSFKADLKRAFSTKIPFEAKAGVKYDLRITDDTRTSENWTHVGRDGLPNTDDDVLTQGLGNTFLMGRSGYGPFPFPKLVTSKEALAPAAFWKKTAAQAYSELIGASAKGTNIEEESPSAYLMGTARMGKVRAVFGVRAEQTEVTSYSWIRNDSVAWGGNSVGGTSLDPVVVAANVARAERSYVGRKRANTRYTEVFPGMHWVWEPKDGFLFRASYNRSIARPSIGATLPTATANDELMRVTIGNPDLKPYLSDNFEISVEKYLEPVGLISVGAFQKNITRYFRTFSDVVGAEGIDGAGTYAGFERLTSRNIGSAKVKGMEFNFQRQFRDLPGIFSGLGAFGNFTYLKTVGDFGTTSITTRLPNMTPRSANAGISYVGHGWQVRPLLNWQGRTYRGTSGNVDFDSAPRTRIDLKINYALSKRYFVEMSLFNLTNQADNALISSDGRLPFVEQRSGTAYSLGVTGRF
jgi:TonB-dependent receptor